MPHTVRLHRVMGTKPEKIYRAFLEADALAKWLPPNGFTCTVHELAAKVGGRFGMSFRNFTTGQSQSFGGEYLELMPNERVVYTDKFDDPNLPGQIQVTVTLKKVSCGTELHIVQEGLPDVIPPEPVILAGRNPCAIWQGSLNPKSINSLNNRAAAATHARAELSRRLAERPVCRAMCSRYVLVVYKAVCNGRAGFSDLAADRAGFAFLLIASAGGLSVAGR